MSPEHQNEVASKLPSLHPEMIMFSGKDNPNSTKPTELLPGWGQTGGNSILVNGQPLNANVSINSSQSASQICGITPEVAGNVRVTGAMIIDKNHDHPLEIHPVYAFDLLMLQTGKISAECGVTKTETPTTSITYSGPFGC